MWVFPVTLFYCHIVGTPLCFKILGWALFFLPSVRIVFLNWDAALGV